MPAIARLEQGLVAKVWAKPDGVRSWSEHAVADPAGHGEEQAEAG